jgi:hypothetical protein
MRATGSPRLQRSGRKRCQSQSTCPMPDRGREQGGPARSKDLHLPTHAHCRSTHHLRGSQSRRPQLRSDRSSGPHARFAESAGEILLAAASWMLIQILAGCLAYAIAVYGIPQAALGGESGDPEPSSPPPPPRNPSRPPPHVISVDAEEDIRADKILTLPDAARPCANASTRRTDARRAFRLAHRHHRARGSAAFGNPQMIAELQNLDDQSPRNIGISRADIGYIVRPGARPE